MNKFLYNKPWILVTLQAYPLIQKIVSANCIVLEFWIIYIWWYERLILSNSNSHPSYQKIVSLIVWNYYCPGLKMMICYYYKNYHACKHSKALKDQYNGLSKPLSILSYSGLILLLTLILSYLLVRVII